jgi:hypothetical protein
MTKTNIIYAEDASGSRFSAGRVRYGRGCERHRFAVRESQAAKNQPTSGPAGALLGRSTHSAPAKAYAANHNRSDRTSVGNTCRILGSHRNPL